MCTTINKYRNSIDRLKQDIYPSLEQALNTLSSENKSSLTDLSYTFSVMQKEFQSLKIFEEQFVFPIILSLFDESQNDEDFAPDVPEIIRVTSIKEERLKAIMDQIVAILQHAEILTLIKNKDQALADNLQGLITIFYNRFLPAKHSWKYLLTHLQNGAAHCNNRASGKCNMAARFFKI
jgi:hypothetical protein